MANLHFIVSLHTQSHNRRRPWRKVVWYGHLWDQYKRYDSENYWPRIGFATLKAEFLCPFINRLTLTNDLLLIPDNERFQCHRDPDCTALSPNL